MKTLKIIFTACLVFTLTTSCFKDQDDDAISSSEITDFVWKGMNTFYLYKDFIPNLANDRFSSDEEYASYLNSYSSPEELFESLIYQRQTVDRFSVIVDDYIQLEQLFSGVFKSNGLEYDFYYHPGSNSDVFGIIRIVLNNSRASELNLQRGQIFDAVDGVPLTVDNLNTVLNQDSYTLNFADYNTNGTPGTSDDTITSNSDSANLTKQPYTENPVYKTEILQANGENVGYLMYNSFTSDFNSQLNNAFGEFKANNIQKLVLDLRYNPGGSVNTANLLGSMITGQFNGQVFAKLNYNSGLQEFNTIYNFTNELGSGSPINSLNLTKLYVLTSSRTASASEMIINSLTSYLGSENVIIIGENTTGKSQASITLYDSPDFDRENANPNHTYAMQPLVAITVNKNDEVVPANGLSPTAGFEVKESPVFYGILGDPSEPLLARALALIDQGGRYQLPEYKALKKIESKVDLQPFEDDMYIDNQKAPPVFRKQFDQQ